MRDKEITELSMNITPHILSIPPYLSTTWKNISSLHAVPEGDDFKLVVMLASRMRVVIPGLDKASIESIFDAHARFGTQSDPSAPLQENKTTFPIAFPFPPAGAGIDLLNAASQHNPAQANAPELPKEILDKIAGIAKVLGLEDAAQLPKAEPHCNCPYCQIARAFHNEPAHEAVAKAEEEIVSEEDLKFRNWDIKQTSGQLYTVSNPLDDNEHYSVFLGEPLGCTCGQKNCEHIRAVLNS